MEIAEAEGKVPLADLSTTATTTRVGWVTNHGLVFQFIGTDAGKEVAVRLAGLESTNLAILIGVTVLIIRAWCDFHGAMWRLRSNGIVRVTAIREEWKQNEA